jgi:hypothetical protein
MDRSLNPTSNGEKHFKWQRAKFKWQMEPETRIEQQGKSKSKEQKCKIPRRHGTLSFELATADG